VAVVVDEKRVAKGDTAVYVPRTAAELAQIETMVRNAVGLDASRGDVVSVVSMRFAASLPPQAEPSPTTWTIVSDYRNELITLVALLLAAFVALRVLRSLRPADPVLASGKAVPELSAGEDEMDDFPAGDEDELDALEAGATPKLAAVPAQRMITNTNTRTRNEVLKTVQERPDVASRLVRAWLKEA
jgi:flagellar M-ring protein FliF